MRASVPQRESRCHHSCCYSPLAASLSAFPVVKPGPPDRVDYINGGELFTHLSQRERFTEHEVQIYVGEIVLALEHLHKNILLDSNGHVMLTDFGLSKEFVADE
ncbi:hypothetical protein Celaphus_00008317, partial [Cervus elaphus hippelaphus]